MKVNYNLSYTLRERVSKLQAHTTPEVAEFVTVLLEIAQTEGELSQLHNQARQIEEVLDEQAVPMR